MIRITKRKVLGTILGVILFICSILSVTYASYYWRGEDSIVTFNFSDPYFYCESEINTTIDGLSPVLNYKDGSYQTFKVNNIGREDTTFSVSLDVSSIDSSLISESFKYKLVVDTTGGSNNCAAANDSNCIEVEGGSGDFSSIQVGMNTLVPSVTLPNNSRYQYYLFMYIDGNMQNDISMQNSSMVSTLGVCEIVAFLNYNGGSGDKEFLKVVSTYEGLPTPTRSNSVVSYNTNGGSSVSSDTVSYTFAGWYLEQNFQTRITASSNVTLTTNHTLYAKWVVSKTVTLPSTTRTGYTFAGWYSDSGLTKKVGNAGESYSPSKSTTLYAKWTANKYTITYMYNGGTKGTNAPTSGTFDSDVQISNPTKTVTVTGNANGTGATVGNATSKAQTFAGWTSNSSAGLGSNAKTGTAANPSTAWSGSATKNTYFRNLRDSSGTVTLTAKWSPVAFNLPIVTKTGYTCKWNTNSDGSGTSYPSGASYGPSANSAASVTMYAICNINSYTLTINPNGGSYNGTTATTTINQDYNTTYGLLPVSKLGYTPSNWSLSGTGTLMTGISSGDSNSKSGFTETLKTDSDGSLYTNYSVSSSPTVNTWYNIKYPNYTFTSGHTYKISVWIRVNTLTGGNLDLRHACVSNDYNSTGRVAVSVTSAAANKGWIEYTMTRTWDGTTIPSSNGNTNVTINPLFEIYTNNLINQTVSMNFDIKNIVITDTTSTSYPYNKDYIYRFGAGNGNLTANYNANTYTIAYTYNGGTKGTNAPTSGTFGTDVQISNPTKTVTVTGNVNGTGATVGNATSKVQTFAGWTSNSSAGLGSNAKTGTAANPSTAWTGSATKNTYFRNLRDSGGKVTLTATWTPVAFNLPTVTKTGYTCKWNTNSDGSGTSYDSGARYGPSANSASKITMYAVCKKNTYTITYKYNGGTKGTNAPASGTFDTDVQISNPTKRVIVTGNANGTGATVGNATSKVQTFAGWTSNSSAGLGSNAKTGAAANPSTAWSGSATKNTYFRNLRDSSGTVTLTATWTPVAFNLPTVTKTGYTCKWNTKSDGSGTNYNSGESYTPSANSAAEITMYAVSCTQNSYTVTYYNGSTKLGTSNHTYGNGKALTTWSNLGGTVKNSSFGWNFAGWSTSNGNTTRTYADGENVNNLTSTDGGNVNLYAVYEREITFKFQDGNGATGSTATQYWNPAGTTNGTHVTGVTSPTLTAISNWTAAGFRNDTTAGAKQYNARATIYPAVAESSILYGVYSRTITFYSGVNKATIDGTRTQYLNYMNEVSAITSYTPATISNWTKLGYRDDTTAGDKEYASATSFSPNYKTGNDMYAVYSRTLTISYNGNGSTSGSTSKTTKTVYLNTNSTTTSSQSITLASNGFSKTGHVFSKWAVGSTSGTQYAAGSSYTPGLAYNASTFGVTVYAFWQAKQLTINYYPNDGTKSGADTVNSATWSTDHYTRTLSYSDSMSTFNLNDVSSLYSRTGYYINTDSAYKVGSTTSSTIISQASADLTSYFVNATNTLNLYANWQTKQLTINYYPNGGTKSGADTVNSATWSTNHYTRTLKYSDHSSTISAFNLNDVSTLYSRTGYHIVAANAYKIGSADATSTMSQDSVDLTSYYVNASNTLNLYAAWVINTYTVTYYNGSTKLGKSNHTYGTAQALTTWSNLGGNVTNSSVKWSFAGWSTSNGNTTRTYTDGASVNNLTSTSGGNVNLYAVYKRTITFKHGASAATSSTATQYWNPAGTKDGTHVTGVTSPTLTAISNWTAAGFRNDTTAGAKEYNAGATIYPAVAESSTLYGAYSRTITFYSGANKATTDGTRTQYLNSNNNAVSAITSYTPANITNWTKLGYRDDTTAGAREYASATSVSPAYTTGNTMYAVYSRTLTISYNGNSSTSGSTANTTKTVYLNTSSTTTSSQSVTLASNGFSRTDYAFANWAAGSTSGTQYGAGKAYDPKLAYNASTFGVTMYAMWRIKNYQIGTSTNDSAYWDTLANAVKNAGAGSTIKVLRTNVDSSSVSISKNLTINTNGKTVTRSSTITINSGSTVKLSGKGKFTTSSDINLITNKGTLTVNLINESNTGYLTNTCTSGGNTIYNTGTLTIEYGYLSAEAGIGIMSSGTSSKVQFKGGNLSSTSNHGLKNTNGTATISGGIISNKTASYAAFCNHESGNATISGGTISNSGGGNAITTYSGSLTVSGSAEIYSNGKDGIVSNKGGKVTVSGGTIQAGAIGIDNLGQLLITGGTITGSARAIRNGQSNKKIGLVMIYGSPVLSGGGSSTAIVNYSDQKWPTSKTSGYLSQCAQACTVHINGRAKVKNTGSGYTVGNHADSSSGYIHLPNDFTGYLYAANNYVLKNNSTSAKIIMNGGNLYAKKGSSYFKSGSHITIDGAVKKYTTAPPN